MPNYMYDISISCICPEKINYLISPWYSHNLKNFADYTACKRFFWPLTLFFCLKNIKGTNNNWIYYSIAMRRWQIEERQGSMDIHWIQWIYSVRGNHQYLRAHLLEWRERRPHPLTRLSTFRELFDLLIDTLYFVLETLTSWNYLLDK